MPKASPAEFCRRQAGRLVELARHCGDARLRDHLASMAHEWCCEAKRFEQDEALQRDGTVGQVR